MAITTVVIFLIVFGVVSFISAMVFIGLYVSKTKSTSNTEETTTAAPDGFKKLFITSTIQEVSVEGSTNENLLSEITGHVDQFGTTYTTTWYIDKDNGKGFANVVTYRRLLTSEKFTFFTRLDYNQFAPEDPTAGLVYLPYDAVDNGKYLAVLMVGWGTLPVPSDSYLWLIPRFDDGKLQYQKSINDHTVGFLPIFLANDRYDDRSFILSERTGRTIHVKIGNNVINTDLFNNTSTSFVWRGMYVNLVFLYFVEHDNVSNILKVYQIERKNNNWQLDTIIEVLEITDFEVEDVNASITLVVNSTDDTLYIGNPLKTVDSIPFAGQVIVFTRTGKNETFVQSTEILEPEVLENSRFGMGALYLYDDQYLCVPSGMFSNLERTVNLFQKENAEYKYLQNFDLAVAAGEEENLNFNYFSLGEGTDNTHFFYGQTCPRSSNFVPLLLDIGFEQKVVPTSI